MKNSGWMAAARCLTVTDYEHSLFFSVQEADQIKARDTWCRGCPVVFECDRFREHTNSEGVWGGRTDWDRGRVRKQPAAGVNRTVENCTEPGRKRSVDRHQSLGEPLCLPCAVYDNEQAHLARVEQPGMFETYPDPKDPKKRVVAA